MAQIRLKSLVPPNGPAFLIVLTSASQPPSFLFGTEPAFALPQADPGLVVVLLSGNVIDALARAVADIAFDVATDERRPGLDGDQAARTVIAVAINVHEMAFREGRQRRRRMVRFRQRSERLSWRNLSIPPPDGRMRLLFQGVYKHAIPSARWPTAAFNAAPDGKPPRPAHPKSLAMVSLKRLCRQAPLPPPCHPGSGSPACCLHGRRGSVSAGSCASIAARAPSPRSP